MTEAQQQAAEALQKALDCRDGGGEAADTTGDD